MNAIVLVAPPHNPDLAGPFFSHLLGEGWDVHGYGDQAAVPDDVAAEADVLIAALAPVDGTLVKRCPKLRLIQVPGHGFDHVDLEAANAAGVPVATIASSGAEAHTVAEWTILIAGAASRKLVPGHTALAEGRFVNVELMQSGIFELAGKTIGIVGFGRIGREVAKRARAFDMRVLYHDPSPPPPEVERQLGATAVPFDELLRAADVVTLHVPASGSTAALIGAEQFALMKHEAILVNTSRGPVVDHDALVEALRTNRIRAAAIDVFDPEPPPPDDPLLRLPNVVLSPHMAGVTAESLLRILQAAAENCRRWAAGEEPTDVVGAGGHH
ncbi:MAG TPA: NAD(P)-dependent oxidoreductase [Actinomycetota bacterium]